MAIPQLKIESASPDSVELCVMGDGYSSTSLQQQDVEANTSTDTTTASESLENEDCSSTVDGNDDTTPTTNHKATACWHILFLLFVVCLGLMLSFSYVYGIVQLRFWAFLLLAILSFLSLDLLSNKGQHPRWFLMLLWITSLPVLLFLVAVYLAWLALDLGALPGTIYLIVIGDTTLRLIAVLVLLPISIYALLRRMLEFWLLCQPTAPEEQQVTADEDISRT